jgi:glycerol-3-phosphate O-acyltransferase
MVVWLTVIGFAAVAVLTAAWYARRSGRRALLRFRARIDRFKLAGRKAVRERLLSDPIIREAVVAHAAETNSTEGDVWSRVDGYIHEIVPFFNVVAYYQLGYRAAEWLLNLFYKVTVEHEDEAALESVPRDGVLIYLINHRSNADYVLVSYALAGRVAISYAVGEWARAFPLEHIFKAFGSYFVRRRYREPLYHAVLERYVQLITREGVTQGIFLEGGLTRDGRLKPPKIGLLDYILGIARDPAYRSRMHVVPVAVNYDRVLEDRSLLAELASREGGRPRSSRWTQFRSVARYVWWNAARLVARRWQRYGRAAVVVGAPMPLESWFAHNADLYDIPKPERLARVQGLSDDVMSRIGKLIPVTPVPLACAAIQSFDRDFIPRADLLERMGDMRDVLLDLNGRVVRHDRIEDTLDRAWRMLKMRRVLAEHGAGYAVLPKSRELVSYYANSVAHLLGPFELAVRERDRLPATATSGIS